MSFCVTHRSALDKNLRHLYSGLPKDIRLRTYSNSQSGAIDILDRVLEKQRRPPGRHEVKFQEYVPAYNARLPRAPAFRSVSPEEAKQISDRLSRPTVMSKLRQRATSSGSTPRRDWNQMSVTDEGGSDQHSDGPSSAERYPGHRRVSYRDWSDNESGVVYYEDDDTYNEESIGKSNDEDLAHHTEDHEWRYREEYSFTEEPSSVSESRDPDESKFTHDTTSESVAHNGFNDENINCYNNKEDEKDVKSQSSKGSPRDEIGSKRTSHSAPKRKMNLLEQIMQARSTNRPRQQRPKLQTGTKDSRPANRKQPINSRLGYSPYSEPTPRLYLVYNQPHRIGLSSQVSRRITPNKLYNSDGKPVKSAPNNNAVRGKTPISQQRPRTTVGPSNRRKEFLTYQYMPETRATPWEYPRRSKSAPPPEEFPDGKTRKTHSSNYPGNHGWVPKGRTAHQTERGKEVNHSGSKMYRTNRTISGENMSRMSSSKNRRSGSGKDKDRDTASRSVSRSELYSRSSYRSAHRPDYETLYLMHSGQMYESHNRRYASPDDMRRANNRLMKPTTAKVIRDRMRYAPNNDTDLADPVKVVREAVEIQGKRRDKRGRLHERDGQEDQEDEEEGEEEESSLMVSGEIHKAKVNGQTQKGNYNDDEDDEKGTRGSRVEEKQNTRSSSLSSSSSSKHEKHIPGSRSRSRSRSRSLSPRSSRSSRSGSQGSSRSRSRSRSGSTSPARSRSQSPLSQSKSQQSRNSVQSDEDVNSRGQKQQKDDDGNDVSHCNDESGAESNHINDNTNDPTPQRGDYDDNQLPGPDKADDHSDDPEANYTDNLSDDAVKNIVNDYEQEERRRKSDSQSSPSQYRYSADGSNTGGRGTEYQDLNDRGDERETKGLRYSSLDPGRGDHDHVHKEDRPYSHEGQPQPSSPPVTYSVKQYYATESEHTLNDSSHQQDTMDSSYDDTTFTDADYSTSTRS